MIIYADVLIILNAYVDYILILSTEKILKLKAKVWRRVLGAFVGALSSLSIFLPFDSNWLSALIGAATAAIIAFTVFGFRSFRGYLKCVGVMYALSCAYCGIMLMLWKLTGNDGIIINNGVVYFNISPLFLILTTVICYLFITIITKLISRHRALPVCTVDITVGSVSESMRAMVDTGNTLHDQLSGLPVIIIDKKSAQALLGADICTAGPDALLMLDLNGFRFIPCSSVLGKGCLPAFRPDSIMLCINGEYSFVKAYIAVSDNRFADGIHAVVGAQIIPDKETLTCC